MADVVRGLVETIDDARVELDDYKRRIKMLEEGKSFLSQREPPRVPKFPKVLRLYGIVPREERTA